MENKPRVLFLPRWYPSYNDPMLGLFVQQHALSVQHIAEVAVIYVHPLQENETATPPGIVDELGIKTVRIFFQPSALPFIKGIVNIILYLLAQLRGYRLLRKQWGQPDLCHVHVMTRPGFLALWLFITKDIPYVITEHWSRYLPGNSTAYRGWARKMATELLVRHAKGISAVTKALLKGVQASGLQHREMQIIPNVVDTSRFRPAGKKKADVFTFLHVSCFDEKAKNVKGLLRVTARLRKIEKPFRLILAGTGTDHKEIRRYCTDLGLDDIVHFTGLLEGPVLVETYQQADVLVLFSNYETQGIVVLEAFACGVPAVTSDAGGLPEIMAPDRGIIAEAGNEQALFLAMIALLEGQEFSPPEVLHQYVRDHFSPEAISHKFLAFYLSALTKDRGK